MPQNSVYSLFPFFTPQATEGYLKKLHILPAYNTARPVARPPPRVLRSVAEIGAVLKDRKTYRVHQSALFEETAARFSALANVYVRSVLSEARVVVLFSCASRARVLRRARVRTVDSGAT